MARNQTVPQDQPKNGGGAAETDLPDPQQREEKINIFLVDDRADKFLAVETVIAELGQYLVIARSGQQRIFHTFERLHSAEQYSGTGIGLAIVSKAAERMGGRVGVESQPHQGSRFWVVLPKAPHS